MKPEDWAKLLYTYGPSALLVFFMFIGEMKARSILKDPAVNKKFSIPIYATTWGVILTLMGFSLSAWYRITFYSEYTIRGTLEHLQGSETLASRDNNLFLSRRYGPNGTFDYAWRLITTKRLEEGKPVSFVLALGNAESEKTRIYNLQIHSTFYSSDVTLSYDRLKDKLMLLDGAKNEELVPDTVEAVRQEEPPARLFTWKVEAQAAQRQVPIQDRLEAGDPIIRRDARNELAQQSQQQWQFIESALANPASSYRLKLGVISALSSNRCAGLSKLSPAALETVIQSSADADSTLRGMARGCLVAQASPAIDAGLDNVIRSSAKARTNAAELARTQLEVLYTLGIAAKDRYGSRKAQDRKEIDRAIGDFRKAWGLRTAAGTTDKVIFAKALYGWGLALHDRSWIDRDASRQRKPAYVRAAQEKFSEFLREVQNSGNAVAYPYPQHLRQAEAYVKTPSPESLKIS